MTFEIWLANRWIEREASSPQEIQELLAKVDRDISGTLISDNTADWRLAMAYAACHGCATAALRCHGYRIAGDSGHHYRTIESLKLTLSPDSEVIRTLQSARQKRNVATYEAAGRVSETEVAAVLMIAKELRRQLTVWIPRHFPELMP